MTKTETETRVATLELAELRVEPRSEDRPPKIVGKAAVFDTWSDDLGGFKEIIRPGAFRESLERGDDVRAMVDHDPARILGRRKSGTLKLRETREALLVEITPPETTVGRDVVESLRRGDLDGMSIGFNAISDRWGLEDEQMVRELLQVDLLDVSVVAFPAYPATQAALRSLEEYRRSKGDVRPAHRSLTMTRCRLRLAEHED